MLAIAGFTTNYPVDLTNPVFSPQSNTPGVPGGFGRVYTKATFLQIAPTVSLAVTDQLSIGFGPTLTLGEVIVDPLVFAAPDDADGSGAPRYPSGRGTRFHFGGGAQLGVYYKTYSCWNFGASIKSPQWMEDIHYKTEDELGRPRGGSLKLDLPMIVSVGTSYTGFENILVAVDVNYYDYKNTDGFKGQGFNPDGSVAGLGWESIFSVATGVQYQVNEGLSLRLGYTFNENPTPSSETLIAAATPLFYQHQLHVGASKRLGCNLWVHLAYTHILEAEITGPIVSPAGIVPGSSVTNKESVHLLSLGATVHY